jgi:ribosomal protein S18 acetylase RimI-like enzyme
MLDSIYATLRERLMMISYKRLSELSIEDVVALWNRSFEEYYVNMTMTVSSFLKRVVFEDLSLEHSFAAYEDGQAIGIVLNGFRQVEGKKTAWNGGTGIALDYRGKGVGLALMQKNIELYQSEGVQLAKLEAFIQNDRAIKLYEKVGYRINDNLEFLVSTDTLPDDAFIPSSFNSLYSSKRGMARDIQPIFSNKLSDAWQTQWPSLKDGQSILIFEGKDAVGYALYKRVYDESGHLTTIILFQCEASPSHKDEETIIRLAIHEVFQPFETTCKRMTFNLRKSNTLAVQALLDAGFTEQDELVKMSKVITN